MSDVKVLMISIVESKYINLGISQLAGYLRNHGLSIDMLFFHNGEDEKTILSKIKNDFTYYAFSVSQQNINKINRIVEKIKKENKDAKIIFGGAFASLYYIEIAKDCPAVDYIILGDGEIPMLHLLSGNSVDNYPYIYSTKKKHGNYMPYTNCSVDWNIAEDYYLTGNNKRHIHSIITKNNVCTGACTFCCTNKTQEIRYKSIDSLIQEIVKFSDLYGIHHFYFIDNDLFDPGDQKAKERIYDFCLRIIKLQQRLHFYCSTKVTTFKDEEKDHELLDVMYQAGFDSIFFGVEAANDEDLILYNKRNRMADNIRCLQLVEKHKIHPDIGFICFNPYSTMESIKNNFQFLIKFKIEDISHYTQSFLEIYKNSAFYTLAQKRDLFNEKFDYMHLDEYYFVSKDAEKISSIVIFLKSYFKNNPLFSTENGWARFSVFFNGLLRYNKYLTKYLEEYNLLKKQYFSIIYSYFKKLYIDGDVDYCTKKYEKFKQEYETNNKEMNRLRARIIVECIRSNGEV